MHTYTIDLPHADSLDLTRPNSARDAVDAWARTLAAFDESIATAVAEKLRPPVAPPPARPLRVAPPVVAMPPVDPPPAAPQPAVALPANAPPPVVVAPLVVAPVVVARVITLPIVNPPPVAFLPVSPPPVSPLPVAPPVRRRPAKPTPKLVGPLPSTDGVDVERLCRKMRAREERLTVPAGADLRAARIAYRWLVWSFGKTGRVPEWATVGPSLRCRIDAGRFDRIREQMVEYVVSECRAVVSADIPPMEYLDRAVHLDDDAERARRAAIYAAQFADIVQRVGGAVDGHAGREWRTPRRYRPARRQTGLPLALVFPSGRRVGFASLMMLAAWGGYGLSTVSEARRDGRALGDGCRIEPADPAEVRFHDLPLIRGSVPIEDAAPLEEGPEPSQFRDHPLLPFAA